MKRLFQVVVKGKPTYFDKKYKAKAFRNENKGSHVSVGPDHRRYVATKPVKTHFSTKGHRSGQKV